MREGVKSELTNDECRLSNEESDSESIRHSSFDIRQSESDSTRNLERNNFLLVLLGTMLSCLFRDLPLTLSFFAGGILTVINLRLLRIIVSALVGERKMSKGKLIAQVVIKFLGMMGAVAFLMLVLKPHPIAFLLGLSTLVAAITLEGVLGIFRKETA